MKQSLAEYVVWQLKDIEPEELTTAEQNILARAVEELAAQPKEPS